MAHVSIRFPHTQIFLWVPHFPGFARDRLFSPATGVPNKSRLWTWWGGWARGWAACSGSSLERDNFEARDHLEVAHVEGGWVSKPARPGAPAPIFLRAPNKTPRPIPCADSPGLSQARVSRRPSTLTAHDAVTHRTDFVLPLVLKARHARGDQTALCSRLSDVSRLGSVCGLVG